MATAPFIKARQMAARFNLFISLFWTVLCLGPAAWYCYLYVPPGWLWVPGAASLLPYFVPKSWLNHSASTGFYERIGVRGLLKFVQHGKLVNGMIRKRYPGYRIIYNSETIHRKVKETYMFERFHYGLFLALLILTFHARNWYWILVLLVCNIGYNVYPVFMQQYVRLRLKASRHKI